jgi:hypothetical protein
MNARNAFALKNDRLKRNQFGGTLGGPIEKQTLVLRRFQGTTERAGPSDIFAYIPTPSNAGGRLNGDPAPACNGEPQINRGAVR